jgi:hypothetical protein
MPTDEGGDRENAGDEPALPEDAGGVEDAVSEDVREWVREQQPDEETRRDLLQEHLHHLIRPTESAYTVDRDAPPGIEIDATVYVRDTYCFTCSEWIGLSGIDLRGTPRSKAEAYYFSGPPDDLLEARATVRERLGDLAEYALKNVDQLETAEDAFEFIGEQHEQVMERIDDIDDAGDGKK